MCVCMHLHRICDGEILRHRGISLCLLRANSASGGFFARPAPEEFSKLKLHTSNQRKEFFQSVRDLFLFALGWWHFISADVRRTRDFHCERDHILSLGMKLGRNMRVPFCGGEIRTANTQTYPRSSEQRKWSERNGTSRKMDRNVATQGWTPLKWLPSRRKSSWQFF